jgi:hypothetical protein
VVYTNSDFGVTLAHPSTLEKYCSDKYQCAFNPPSTGAGSDNFVYLSIIPEEKTAASGQIYNYDPKVTNLLLSMKVGESKNTNDTITGNGFIYTRLPDMTVGGITASVYENKNPWEFALGTTEKRIYLKKDNVLYLFGAYKGKEIEEKTFNQILSSFKFTN